MTFQTQIKDRCISELIFIDRYACQFYFCNFNTTFFFIVYLSSISNFKIITLRLLLLAYNTNMRTNIKFHTRDTPSSCYRQSLSVLSSQLVRNSLSIDSTSPSIYRESLGTQLKSRNTMALQVLEYLRQELEQERIEKEKLTFYNLKTTLSSLQERISQAKKHFNSSQTLVTLADLDDEILTKQVQNEKTLTYSGQLNTTLSSSGKIQIPISEFNNSQSPKLKNYYLNNLPAALDGRDARALDHMHFSLRVLKNYYKIASPTFAEIQEKKVYLPRSKSHTGKKSLILDIDQTLIHCEEDPRKPYDIAVPIEIENGSKANAYITIRPYAISFLKRMAKHYEIIAFTASHESYADAVLDEIDPEREYIKHRLYRKNCIEVYDKIFVKDLRVINRDLNSMVLVDNAPYSYIFQLENGIPILPYYSGDDVQLLQLEKYLQEMVKCHDVREFNKKHFQLHRYSHFDDSQQLIKELYQ